jgi:lysophospholipase L1-like esterase
VGVSFLSGSQRLLVASFVLAMAALALCGQARDFSQWENDIKAFEAADAEQMPPKKAILFIGSSSIRMWTDIAKDFPAKKVINRGFGGSQIVDSTYFADRIVIPYKPKMIVLYAGDNDLQDGLSPEQVLADYKAFVEKVRGKLPKVKIAFISIKPSPSRAALLPQVVAANELIRTYSAEEPRMMFIDIYTPMLGPDGQPRKELFVADMLHLNRQGYDIWKEAVAPYLK